MARTVHPAVQLSAPSSKPLGRPSAADESGSYTTARVAKETGVQCGWTQLAVPVCEYFSGRVLLVRLTVQGFCLSVSALPVAYVALLPMVLRLLLDRGGHHSEHRWGRYL